MQQCLVKIQDEALAPGVLGAHLRQERRWLAVLRGEAPKPQSVSWIIAVHRDMGID